MTATLNREDIVAALIRHPDLELRAVRSRDIWTLLDGEGIEQEARNSIDERLAETSRAQEIEAEYQEQGIWTLTCLDEGYPQRLRERLGVRAPALLHGFGEKSLLASDGIGVVGSRNLSTEVAEVTGDLARTIAAAGRTLISGGAKGADQIAMSKAAERGGSVVGVLTHPLTTRMREPELQRLADDGSACLVTPFRPDMGFTVANAMARNKIIYALTNCTVVMSADLGKGGSWTGANEALRWKLTCVAAWSGPDAAEGNKGLVEKGAHALTDVNQVLDREWIESDGLPGQQMDLLS